MVLAWTETDRLRALRGYAILDTDREAAFEDFVRLAADICDAPIAVINLVDEARQWFKAETGLGVRETPLDVSICAHAILQAGLLVVPDLRRDPRFSGNPLVTGEPRLRFYAGAPLTTADGLPLGTLCVLDVAVRPEGLTARQSFALEALARQVMAQLELRRALSTRRAAEIDKDRLLREKELLVLEVHHRVRNSLQLVQSLLAYRARETDRPEVAIELAESAARVRTVAAVHERLYRSESAHTVEIQAYLEPLLQDLWRAIAPSGPGRTLGVAIEQASWPADDVPALGLIATELVTNALKYGKGRIGVTFRQKEGVATLAVGDEGELPDDFDIGQDRGLGMRLMRGLLASRGGALTVAPKGVDTCFVATFPWRPER